MPPIPQFSASGQINPAALQGQSIESAMAPWRAAIGLASDVADSASVLSSIAAQKKKETELSWVTETAGKFDRALAERRNEDSKNPTPEMADNFRIFADELQQRFSSEAPTKEAKQAFLQHAIPSTNVQYRGSMTDSERARLVAAESGNRQAGMDMSATYTEMVPLVGNVEAAKIVLPSYRFSMASIEARFGKSAPNLAMKMKADLLQEIVLTTAPTNPKFARELIKSAEVPAEVKAPLTTHVDTVENSTMALARDKFGRELQAQLDHSMRTGQRVKSYPDEAFAIFGKHAAIELDRFRESEALINRSVDIADEVGRGASPHALANRAIKAMASKDPKDSAAGKVLAQAASRAAAQVERDPLEWQLRNDPDLAKSIDVLAGIPPDAQAEFKAGIIYQALERQGPPPAGAEHPERYLNLTKTHVLTVWDAEQRRNEILSLPPDQALEKVMSLESEFGDPVIANKAYSDLMSLGDGKLPVGIRFAAVINNPNVRKDFFNAQRAKGLDKIDDAVSKEYQAEIDKNTTWSKFIAGWIGGSLEGSVDISDAQAAVTRYAESIRIRDNVSPSAATKRAIAEVVDANYGFAMVHSHPIPIGRKRMFGGPERTDAEISDIGRRLEVALRDIPVQELQIVNADGTPKFPFLPSTYDPNNPRDAQLLRDVVTSSGFWEMDETGEMVTLMVAPPGFGPFALTDKNGRNLTVAIDNLPNYTTEWPSLMAGGRDVRAETPSATYQILDTSIWKQLGFGQPTTNWPVRQPWLSSPIPRNFKLD